MPTIREFYRVEYRVGLLITRPWRKKIIFSSVNTLSSLICGLFPGAPSLLDRTKHKKKKKEICQRIPEYYHNQRKLIMIVVAAKEHRC